MPEQKRKPSLIRVDAMHSVSDQLEASLFNERKLRLTGEIEEWHASDLAEKFEVLSLSPEPIELYITSYGGAVDAGSAIIRAIRYAQEKGCQVTGEVRGYAMSMAACVLQACDLRFAAPEDIVMVHGFAGVAVGDIRNQEADVKMTKRLTDVYAKFFAERSTADDAKYHDEDYWRKLLEDSLPHYYFGYEALEVGLLDDVL